MTLRPLDETNARPLLQLQVGADQRDYVASNAESIADCYIEAHMRPLAIYAGEELIGMTVYERYPPTGKWWISRLMIDQHHQHQGYGRAAMELLLQLMRDIHRCPAIHISVVPGNDVAARLYVSLGFQRIEMDHFGEEVYLLQFDTTSGTD